MIDKRRAAVRTTGDEDGMVTQSITGVTWGHRRAIEPLQAATVEFMGKHPDISVNWRIRTLQDFEHQPLEVAMRGVDVLILDHPMVGAIAESGLFVPVDDVLAGVPGGTDPKSYIGPSLESYRWRDRFWAVPVDGATVNAIFRPDVLDVADLPVSWKDALDLGRALRRSGRWLGMAAGDHHALMTLQCLMANLGAPWPTQPGAAFVFDERVLSEAIGLVRQAVELAPPEALGWNSIALHDAMIARGDVVYCPATYGYATYGEADQTARLCFGPFAGAAVPYCAGTALGGAGAGMSARSEHPEAVRALLRFLASADVQHTIFATHRGQPARIEAWEDSACDAIFNGYFSSVAETMTRAWIRPRFNGYNPFEREAGRLFRAHLLGEISEASFIAQLRAIAPATVTA